MGRPPPPPAPRAGRTAWILPVLWAVIALVANVQVSFLDVPGTVAVLVLHLGLPYAARHLGLRSGRNLTGRQISSLSGPI